MRSRHKRTNNEHGHFTIINYMQKKHRREIIAWIWTHSLTKFAFPACNSSKHCMYVCLLFWASLYAICTHVCSCLILARIKKKFPTYLLIYTLRFWRYIAAKKAHAQRFYIVFYPEFEASVLDGSIKHNVDTR